MARRHSLELLDNHALLATRDPKNHEVLFDVLARSGSVWNGAGDREQHFKGGNRAGLGPASGTTTGSG
jgi:hypothetical protein